MNARRARADAYPGSHWSGAWDVLRWFAPCALTRLHSSGAYNRKRGILLLPRFEIHTWFDTIYLNIRY